MDKSGVLGWESGVGREGIRITLSSESRRSQKERKVESEDESSASASTLRSRLSLRALGTGMRLVSRPRARRACGGIRVRRRACRRGTRCLVAKRI